MTLQLEPQRKTSTTTSPPETTKQYKKPKAEANANARKIFDAMQQMKTNQENNIPDTMTEEQARQQYPYAFLLSDYQISTAPHVGFEPKYYGFGSGENKDGKFQNFGYYQLSESENGVAWKGPGYNYDVSGGSLSTDFDKMTPYVYPGYTSGK